MRSFIRRRLTLANALVVVALVFALSGGAYAASKVLITSTKQISPKVLRDLRGAPGATGEKGAPGPQGAKGETGSQGGEGKAGESVEIKEFAEAGGSCTAGGAEFTTHASTAFACNGMAGAQGEEGPAGKEGAAGQVGPEGKAGESVTVKEFGGANGKCVEGGTEVTDKTGKGLVCNGKSAASVLQKGQTERGTFAVNIGSTTFEGLSGKYSGILPITFPIPLPALEVPVVRVIPPEETTSHCEKAGPEAEAEEGSLCLYVAFRHPENTDKPLYEEPLSVDPYGFALLFEAPQPEGYVEGEWAVTAN